jgi:DNA-binding transcriptional ArsR family regulator
MDSKMLRKYQMQATILKSVAHPTRIFLLEELAQQERCVCELAELVGADISTVSRHLTILKNAGIVRDDKRGVQVYYNLQAPCALSFLSCVENIIKINLKTQQELVA